MSTCEHNNKHQAAGSAGRPGVVKTLGDLRDYVAGKHLPDTDKSQIRSAIKRADELIGHGSLDLPADPRQILTRLEHVSPAMAGMSRQALANLKSRVRKAFQLARPALQPARSRAKLWGPWLQLYQQLTENDRRNLARFLRFGASQEWTPEEITDAHVQRFADYLDQDVVIPGRDRILRATVRTWNRLAGGLTDWPLQQLTPRAGSRTPYWLQEQQLPESFRQDLADYLAHLSGSKGFTGRAHRKLAPGTIDQNRCALVALASAQVAAGRPVEELTSLSQVVQSSALEKALTFLFDRNGEVVTDFMLTSAGRARKVAAWCKLPQDELERLDDLLQAVKLERPPRRGMAQKNRDLLRRLDDPRFLDHLLLLPQTLLRRAHSRKDRRRAPSDARDAVAVELLLTCAMRRENLVHLSLEETIRRLGSGRDSFWAIELPPEDVKNDEPLRFQLPRETGRLLEIYLKDWRGRLCPQPTPWLFPTRSGKPIDGKTLWASLGQKTERELGVRITPHQFRHLSGELYLLGNPDGLTTVSLHLGHRDLNTARRYYTRPKQREATRRYQEHLIAGRETAKRRVVIRRRKHAADEELGGAL